MSDDQEDILDTGDLDSGADDFSGGKSALSDALRGNPLIKVGIVFGAFVLIVGGIILFGGKKEPIAVSNVQNAVELKQPPGMEKTSAVYEDAIKEVNEQNVEKALREGGSALPVPIGPSRGRVEIGGDEKVTEDPLERWRKIQEERLRKEQGLQATGVPTETVAPVDPYAEAKQALSQSMATQMQSILDGVTIKPPKSASITPADYFENKRKAEEEKKKSLVAKSEANPLPQMTEVLLEAGRIEYAQLIIEANTDSPGPVLAELASGPLAGSRMIGTFQATDKYLTLKFDTVIVDGVALTTDAIALDPVTSKPGMVTEIDHKYFQRVILPAAAAFIEGLGGAIADSGTTTVSAGNGTTVSDSKDLDTRQEFFKGVEKASDKIGEIVDQTGAKARPMLRLAAGTHIGILFTESVEKNSADALTRKDEQEKNKLFGFGQQGFQMPFQNPMQQGQMQNMQFQYPAYSNTAPQMMVPTGTNGVAQDQKMGTGAQ